MSNNNVGLPRSTGGGGKQSKSGIVVGSSFTGTPLEYPVVFSTPFADDTIYAVAFGGTAARDWTVKDGSQSEIGFIIQANANTTFPSLNCQWLAQEVSE